MTVRIEFSPEIEAKLREHSRAAGHPVEEIVRQAVEGKLSNGSASRKNANREEWVRQFRDWVASHPARPGVNLDDSRESIYD